MGTLKADKWWTLGTIYLLITLISWRGKSTSHVSAEEPACFLQVVKHTMCLISAVIIVSKHFVSPSCSSGYLKQIFPTSKLSIQVTLLTQWMMTTSFWLGVLLDLLFPKIFGLHFILATLKSTSSPDWSKRVSSTWHPRLTKAIVRYSSVLMETDVKCGKIVEVTLGTPDIKSGPMRCQKGLWLQLMCCTPFRLLPQDFRMRQSTRDQRIGVED